MSCWRITPVCAAMLLAGCAGTPPEDVALAADRAMIAGDELKYRSYLTADDQKVFDQVHNTDTLVQMINTAPEHSTTADSARLDKSSGDSADVSVFRTVPDYSRGASLRSGESLEEWAARLPRTTERRPIWLVREGASWRVIKGLREELAYVRHYMFYDESVPLEVRAQHAEGILRTTQRSVDLDHQMRSFIRGARIAKSLRIRLQQSPYSRMTQIHVDNPSASRLGKVELVITDADGVEHQETVLDVPARGRKSGFVPKMPLPQRGIRLTKVEAD